MSETVLVDTGPLVAVLNTGDQHHEQCVESLKSLRLPLLTCWPVVTEAAYLLRSYPDAIAKLLEGLETSFLELLPLDESDASAIREILSTYRDQGFQLADASLMHLAEREAISTVFTLDRRDFGVYRPQSIAALRLLP
ncbi:type II toxin-antitoxin system VapC family toxin [Botrimarina mediterranea]|uniref:type II toxin-antitoxin system VapC family toxin n=1 Tax=Botrimarina mediterranea TaxID=2528022 RepID=UPI00118CEFCF|nr:Ribonuclease VapC26 [Planctomycetes bacterium K2D]